MKKAISIFKDTYNQLPGDVSQQEAQIFPDLWAYNADSYYARVPKIASIWGEQTAFAADANNAFYSAPSGTQASQTVTEYSQQYRKTINTYTQKCKSNSPSVTEYSQQCQKISYYSLYCQASTSSYTQACGSMYVGWYGNCSGNLYNCCNSGYSAGCYVTNCAQDQYGNRTAYWSCNCVYSTGTSQTVTGPTSSLSCPSGTSPSGSVTPSYTYQTVTSTTDTTPDCDTANGWSTYGSVSFQSTYDYQYPTGVSTTIACPAGYTADGAPTGPAVSYEYLTVKSTGTPPTSPGPEWIAYGDGTSKTTTTQLTLGGANGSGVASTTGTGGTGTFGAGSSILVSQTFAPGNGRVEMYEACMAMRMLNSTGFISGVPEYEKGGSTLCDYTDINPNGHFGNLTKKSKISKDIGIFVADSTFYSDQTNSPNYVLSSAGTSMHQGTNKTSSSLFTLYPELLSGKGGLGTNAEEAATDYYYNAIALFNVRDLGVAAVSSAIAKQIDRKIDDGKPYTGFLIASMTTANDINSTYSPNKANTKTTKQTTRKYCSNIDTNCVLNGTCTIDNFKDATYQTDSPTALETGCNLLYMVGGR
jgi:hypothetical protein